MMRSTTCFLIFVFALATMMGETEGLASVVRTVRQGVWGRLTSAVGKPSNNAAPPAFVKQTKVPVVTSSLQRETSDHQESASFDADSYRREMTDLVYERSMQRFSQ